MIRGWLVLSLAVIVALGFLASSVLSAQDEAALKAEARRFDQAAQKEGPAKVIQELSQQFNVPEQTIKDLRTQKLGFGEIAILLTLSQKTGKPVSQLLSEFKSGKGWGRIAQENNLRLGDLVSDLHKAAEATHASRTDAGKHDTGIGRPESQPGRGGSHEAPLGGPGFGHGSGGGPGGGRR